jgi:hypothetical protein
MISDINIVIDPIATFKLYLPRPHLYVNAHVKGPIFPGKKGKKLGVLSDHFY